MPSRTAWLTAGTEAELDTDREHSLERKLKDIKNIELRDLIEVISIFVPRTIAETCQHKKQMDVPHWICGSH